MSGARYLFTPAVGVLEDLVLRHLQAVRGKDEAQQAFLFNLIEELEMTYPFEAGVVLDGRKFQP